VDERFMWQADPEARKIIRLLRHERGMVEKVLTLYPDPREAFKFLLARAPDLTLDVIHPLISQFQIQDPLPEDVFIESIILDPVEWADYQLILNLLPELHQIAERYNTPNSGFTDEAFVALMIANVHQESRLRRSNPQGNDFFNQMGVITDWIADRGMEWFGRNSSVGIANIRPNVAEQIFAGIIPAGRPDPASDEELKINFSLPPILAAYASQYQGLNTDAERYEFLSRTDVGLELLGANVHRGIIRAQAEGVKPSVFNISAWLNQGVVRGFGSFLDPDLNDTIRFAQYHSNEVLAHI
jgi:hypothetical protein